VIVPRWTAKLMNGVSELPLGEKVWADTTITLSNGASATRMRDVFTGREVSTEGSVAIADALAEFPVAVIHAKG
jgi:maltooligosyltrehalose synthase